MAQFLARPAHLVPLEAGWAAQPPDGISPSSPPLPPPPSPFLPAFPLTTPAPSSYNTPGHEPGEEMVFVALRGDGGEEWGEEVMSDKIVKKNGGHVSPFERIRKVNEAGNEYWESRDLAAVLDYTQYRNFEVVIEKAKMACFNSGQRIENHFADVSKMVEIGSGATREIKVTLLSRYACYLVIQNADPNKEIVAHGQTYFAIQTRRQELADEHLEEDRRFLLREEMRRHNVQLADAAKDAGVIEPIDYAIFQNHGVTGHGPA